MQKFFGKQVRFSMLSLLFVATVGYAQTITIEGLETDPLVGLQVQQCQATSANTCNLNSCGSWTGLPNVDMKTGSTSQIQFPLNSNLLWQGKTACFAVQEPTVTGPIPFTVQLNANGQPQAVSLVQSSYVSVMLSLQTIQVKPKSNKCMCTANNPEGGCLQVSC